MRRTLSVCVAITVAAGGFAATSPAAAAAPRPHRRCPHRPPRRPAYCKPCNATSG